MSQGGFLDTRKSSPLGLGLVLALHAVALTALIVAKGPQILPGPDIFTVQSIPDTPPPPPETAPPPESRTETRVTRVDTPEVIVQTDAPTIRFDDPPVIDLGPIAPAGPAIDPPVAPPAPKIVEARLDLRRSTLQPPYPPSLSRMAIEGRVTVRVLIGTDGRVKAVEPVSADDPLFHEATAKQALRAWRFEPATRDGVAIESWRTMTVRFEMAQG